MPAIIGVDVGGTNLRAARFDSDLVMLDRAEQASHAEQGTDAVLNRLYETIRQVLPEDPGDLAGIGLAIPGPVNTNEGVILKTPNLPFYDVPITKLVKQAVGGPVFLGNDADLAGLGEYQLGAGRDANSMIYMTVSTGIGAGIVIDGKILVGAGLGGEIGHMVVEPDGPMCGCGQQGHLEAVASGTAIEHIAQRRLNDGEKSLVRDLVDGDLEKVDARIVGEAAMQGDDLAVSIVRSAGRYLGIGITSLMVILNPEMFVMGGAVTRLGDLLFEPMHEAIKHYALHPRYWEESKIVMAELGDDVGLYGAAAFAQSQLGG